MKRTWEYIQLGYAVVVLLIMSLILLPTGIFEKDPPGNKPPYYG